MLQSMGLQRVEHDRVTEQQHGNFMFNFLRNHQSVLQSSCTILYFHKQYTSVSISSHHCQHLLHSTLFIIAILLDIKWYLMVLTCISLMTIEVEHLFGWFFFDICIFSLKKCLFKYFNWIVFLFLEVIIMFYVISLYQKYYLQIFSFVL